MLQGWRIAQDFEARSFSCLATRAAKNFECGRTSLLSTAEFNEWYNTGHIPALGGVKGTLLARRYRGTGVTQRYATLYHLASSDVPYSSEWKAAANTPWTERMWPYFRDHLRFAWRRHTRAG
jgi:hypothetical protein